jgi:hypothetical protein
MPFARSIVLRFSSACRADSASLRAEVSSLARVAASRMVESRARGGAG